MAIYTFTCTEHGNFDEIVPMGTEKAPCPKCTVSAQRTEIPEVPARRNPAHGIQG